MSRPVISFTLQFEDTVMEINTWHGEFRNLMVLINERIFVEDFGECRGIGRCGTCLVKVDALEKIPEMDRNEESTLTKAGKNDGDWRLSCQLMIDERLKGTFITVADERIDVR